MAEDARISTAFPRHHKTVKIQRRLGVEGCWALLCLFLWVAENRPDGNLRGMTAEDIGIAAGWTGNVGELSAVLAEVRFLDGVEGTYSVHDWSEHNPWAAKRGERIEAARAAANTRWAAGKVSDANDMRVVCGSHTDSMPPTQPNPTHSNPTHPNQNQ